MKRTAHYLLGVALFGVIALHVNSDPFAQGCCSPPLRPSQAPRFPQDAPVTVYIDSDSGFTDTEMQAIENGITDWNDEPNRSGVQFTVVRTANPPSLPPQSHTIVVNYDPQYSNTEVAGVQTFSSGNIVWNVMTFHANIRVGNPSILPAFVRTVARHETAHTIGLDNAPDCPAGSTIMHIGEFNNELFISDCDNNKIDTDSAYPPPTCPDEDGDGYTTCDGDCDDYDPLRYTGNGCIAPNCEVTFAEGTDNGYGGCASCYNGRDDDCNGYTDLYDYSCIVCQSSPIVVDVLGDGFKLTNAGNGVAFDINGDGPPEHLAWTAADSDDAWLALDRNGDGTINNGGELFGNFTPQPDPPAGKQRNGFLALAEYDKPENGGDNDGTIRETDAVFSSLRLWQDTNHNGVSETSELHTLPELGLSTLQLDYKQSKRVDVYGNQFRYRGKVKDTHDAQLGRWAWDVFLVQSP